MKKNHKMANALSLGVAAVLLLSTLAACAGNGNSTTTSGTAASAESKTTNAASGDKKTVLVWTNNRHDLQYMEQVVDQFNKADNGITIDYQVQTENFPNMLQMAANSQTMPDAFSQVDADTVKNFASAGMVEPLQQFFTDEYKKVTEIDKNMYEGLNSIGDNVYWVPGAKRSGSRFIYNVDVVEKLGLQIPKDVAELPAFAKKVTEAGKGEYYGIIFPGASGPFERWILHSGEMSGFSTYDYVNGRYDFSKFKPILEAVKQMFVDGSVFPGSASLKVDPARVQFAEGKVVLHANASQEATVLTEQFPAKINWKVTDVPTIGGEIKGAEQADPNTGWMMSAQSKDKEAAWKVISYFQSEDVLKGYLEKGYALPISEYMAGKIDTSKIGRMADFMGVDYEGVWPAGPAVTPDGDDAATMLWNAVLPESGENSIQEAIDTLNKTYNEALDRDVKMGKAKRLVIKDFNPKKPSEGTREYLEK